LKSMRKLDIAKLMVLVAAAVIIFAASGCATPPKTTVYVPPYTPGYGVFIDHIIAEGLEGSAEKLKGVPPESLPPYYERLLEDGKLTIALAIGTEDLVNGFYDETGGGDLLRVFVGSCTVPANLYGREVIIDAVVVNNKEGLIKALGEREVVFVYSHSRYGNGWALHEDGLDEPFRMQSDPIRIPKKQLHGYKGDIVRETASHYYLRPNTEDLDRVVPYPGFQIIVGLSCTSQRHFQKELLKMRNGNPSLFVLTTGAGSFLEMRFKIFKTFMGGLALGKPMNEIVSDMNDTWQRIPDEFFEEHGIRYSWRPRRVIKLTYSDI
jgi:hypothetical protein